MAKCFGVWYGGPSYAVGEVEAFESIREATDVFVGRREGFDLTTGNWSPCVTDDSTMLIYAEDPTADSNPFVELVFGPRGGVQRRAC
jgi:hypothetical protein